MSTIVPNAVIVAWSEGDLHLKIPSAHRPRVGDIISRCWKRHGTYMKVGFDEPFRPRTTRASGKLHSLIAALSPVIDMNFEECKDFVKMCATEIGYPLVQRIRFKGTKREHTISEPQSEADASTSQEHMLIVTALKIGAEAGHDLEAEYETRMRGM